MIRLFHLYNKDLRLGCKTNCWWWGEKMTSTHKLSCLYNPPLAAAGVTVRAVLLVKRIEPLGYYMYNIYIKLFSSRLCKFSY